MHEDAEQELEAMASIFGTDFVRDATNVVRICVAPTCGETESVRKRLARHRRVSREKQPCLRRGSLCVLCTSTTR